MKVELSGDFLEKRRKLFPSETGNRKIVECITEAEATSKPDLGRDLAA